MISTKHRTIFVHIPKVAGQSIETLFLEDLGLNWDNRQELLLRKKKSSEPGPHRLAHLKAKDYVGLGYLEASKYEEFFSFSFVRNPYSRVISFYNYLGYAKIISISTFIKTILSTKVKEDHFFFRAQYDYLYSEEGRLLVDFVGKLENISEDIEYVLEKVGLEGKNLPYINKSDKGLKRGITSLISEPSLLKHLQLKRMFSHQKVSVLSEDQKDGIYRIYTKDFEYFGYEK
jgi:sulfotransferase famil protein